MKASNAIFACLAERTRAAHYVSLHTSALHVMESPTLLSELYQQQINIELAYPIDWWQTLGTLIRGQ